MYPIMDPIWIQYEPNMDPIIYKNIVNMHRLHNVLQFFKTSLKIENIEPKIALLKIRKHRIVKKKTGIAHPYPQADLVYL